MRLASGENSAFSQPLQPSRFTSRCFPIASTRSGVAIPPSTVTRSTLCVPAAGTMQTTGSALLGGSAGAVGSFVLPWQLPPQGVQRVSGEPGSLFGAPGVAADTKNTPAARSPLVRRDFDATFICVVMITASQNLIL